MYYVCKPRLLFPFDKKYVQEMVTNTEMRIAYYDYLRELEKIKIQLKKKQQ